MRNERIVMGNYIKKKTISFSEKMNTNPFSDINFSKNIQLCFVEPKNAK